MNQARQGDPGFAFRMGPGGNQECCGAPVGCTRTHPGCSFLHHEWKRDVVFRAPDARCTATAVIDNPDGTRDWLRCTRRHHEDGGHVTAVVKTTTSDREEMTMSVPGVPK